MEIYFSKRSRTNQECSREVKQAKEFTWGKTNEFIEQSSSATEMLINNVGLKSALHFHKALNTITQAKSTKISVREQILKAAKECFT
jgi:hypothetical protein